MSVKCKSYMSMRMFSAYVGSQRPRAKESIDARGETWGEGYDSSTVSVLYGMYVVKGAA